MRDDLNTLRLTVGVLAVVVLALAILLAVVTAHISEDDRRIDRLEHPTVQVDP